MARIIPTLAVLATALAAGCSTISGNAVSKDVVQCREHCQQGFAAIRSNEWETADERFAAAVEACPVDQRARQGWADVLWQQGKHDEALRQMATAVRLSGGDPHLRVKLGQMHLHEGNISQAARQASSAIAAEPGYADAWALEGDTLYEQGRWQEALGRYHRAVSHRPDFPHAQLRTAEIYERLGRHQRTYTALAQLDHEGQAPSLARRALELQARCCTNLHRHDEAAANWTQIAQRYGASPDVLYELASAQLFAGQPDAAQQTNSEALALDPSHQPSRQLAERLRRERTYVR